MDQINTAPGHIYHPLLGSGIEWQPGTVRLWQGGQVAAIASHDTASAYEFFYGLKFAECFPAVTHWWFRSDWQGRVQVSWPVGLLDAETLYGYMQFNDDGMALGAKRAAQMWTMGDGAPVELALPMPPGAVEPGNLPLRLALARLVLDTVDEVTPADTWRPISSLVRREELADIFPVSHTELTRELPLRLTALVSDDDVDGLATTARRRYVLEDSPDLPVRELLCVLQGVSPR